MVDLHTLSVTFLLLVLVIQIAAWTYPVKMLWEATDYVWYGLAAGSLLLFSIDANMRFQDRRIAAEREAIASALDRISTEIRDRSLVCTHADARQSTRELSGHLWRFRTSSAFPDGEVSLAASIGAGWAAEVYQTYDDVILFLDDWCTNLDADLRAALSEDIASFEALSATEVDGGTRDWLGYAAYALAFGLALRFGKTTAKLRAP